MEKSNHNQSSAPATTADPRAMKTEIVEAVKDTVMGLATHETVSASPTTAPWWSTFRIGILTDEDEMHTPPHRPGNR